MFIGLFQSYPQDAFGVYQMGRFMEIKGKFFLWNIKIMWISMINFVKCILSVYCILLMKMALDAPTIPSAKSTLSMLIDVKALLGLNVVM
jgi:hypothetical protein